MKTTKALVALLAVAVVGASGAAALAQQGASDAAPEQSASRAPRSTALLDAYGVDWRSAQRGFVTGSGKQLYSTRNARVACVTDGEGSGHCAPRDRLREGLGFGGELCRDDLAADEVRITGVVPEGVGRVTLRTTEGSTWSADARADTVAFEVARSAVGESVQVSWSMGGGRVHTVTVAQPPVVATARCG
jgi:hypothetical protein